MTHDSQRAQLEPYFSSPHRLAPWPHTVGVLILFAVWCIVGGRRVHTLAYGPHVFTYLSSIIMIWMALGTVVAGVYRRRQFFYDTLQRSARRWYIEAAAGLLIYFAVLALFVATRVVLRQLGLTDHADHTIILAMAPQNLCELLMWIAVSASAGFCEEHIFRGYLVPQVIAWGSAAGAPRLLATAFSVLVTSALFGVLHLYQGAVGALMIGLLGVVYAVTSLRLRNLRAVILAHFLQDFITAALMLFHHSHSR